MELKDPVKVALFTVRVEISESKLGRTSGFVDEHKPEFREAFDRATRKHFGENIEINYFHVGVGSILITGVLTAAGSALTNYAEIADGLDRLVEDFELVAEVLCGAEFGSGTSVHGFWKGTPEFERLRRAETQAPERKIGSSKRFALFGLFGIALCILAVLAGVFSGEHQGKKLEPFVVVSTNGAIQNVTRVVVLCGLCQGTGIYRSTGTNQPANGVICPVCKGGGYLVPGQELEELRTKKMTLLFAFIALELFLFPFAVLTYERNVRK